MYNYLIYLISLNLLWVHLAVAGPPLGDNIDANGAVCFIRDEQNQVLLVNDVLTQRWSLPGGRIDAGESPQQAAAREVLEETGLKVSVGELLSVSPQRVLYACQTWQPIPYLSLPKQSHLTPNQVITLGAPHYSTEIVSVTLSALTPALLANYRFPKDAEHLALWASQTPASLSELYSGITAPDWLLMQTHVIYKVQQFLAKLPWLTQLLSVMDLLGQGEVAAMALVWALICLPRRLALTTAFGLWLVAASVNLFKIIAMVPRPYYLMPILQQTPVMGYAMPSGHTAQAFVLLGLLALFASQGRSLFVRLTALTLAMLLALLTGIAQIWLGVHYLTDVMVGLLMGGGILALCRVCLAPRDHNSQANGFQCDGAERGVKPVCCLPVESVGFWLSLSLLSAGVALWYQWPLFSYLTVACAGICLGLFAQAQDQKKASALMRARYERIRKLCAAAFIGGCFFYLTPVSSLYLLVKNLLLSGALMYCLVHPPRVFSLGGRL